jgi:hypothetical protein
MVRAAAIIDAHKIDGSKRRIAELIVIFQLWVMPAESGFLLL